MLQRKDGWKLAVLGIFLAAFASGFALLAKAPPAQQKNYVGGDTCLACHDIEEAFAKNPHYKSWKDESLPWDKRGCETCHGPVQATVFSPCSLRRKLTSISFCFKWQSRQVSLMSCGLASVKRKI